MSARIGVLMGGLSAEKEISLKTGEAVYQSLARRGHEAVRVFVDRHVDRVLRQERIDVAFLALHGRYGEDGCIQGLLEILGIPYTGSGVLASALAMDKAKAKEILRLHNLPVPTGHVITRDSLARLEQDSAAFALPAVVKPACEGSSIGVSIVHDAGDLPGACEEALRLGDACLIERLVEGREISVAVCDDQPLGAVEIAPGAGFYDYASKYVSGRSQYFVPARLPAERYRAVLRFGARAHQALGCSGVTRVDLIVGDRGTEAILEVNTLPGMTPTSLVPKIAAACGMTFDDLVEKILAGARLHTRVSSDRRVRHAPPPGADRRADATAEPN